MSVDSVDTDEHAAQLYQLRIIERKTWRDIGKTLGMSHEGARKSFYRHLGRGVTDEERENYRAEQTEKLDIVEQMYREVAERAMADENLSAAVVFGALDGLLKTHDRLARINALNQPITVEVRTTLDEVTAKFDAYLKGVQDGAGSALPAG